MPITAAQIESNGWVLRLTLTGTPGSFASYALDPGGTPRLALTSAHPGFVKSAGTAVAGSYARAFVGTKPLRKPVNPASPTVAVIDETDLGGGSIRVRIALSTWIYATDTGITLSAAAGWRTGETAQAGISVSNGSTLAAPIPIMRWVLPNYDVTTGTFRLSLIVGSHHPVGFEPVAGVKFTATDGTNVKTVWTTALGTDSTYGDNLRCYTATIDPATATALTAGLLRCDAEVYPWLGAMRPTDTAGTKSMATLASDGLNTAAASPFVIGYDPAGSRYSNAFVYVDPAGTATASVTMVATTLAGARAVPQASRANSVSVAVQAGYLANRTLAAANGGAAVTRSVDGLQIVLAPATHAGIGSTNVTFGTQSAEIPILLMGDPADANPRANCIIQTGATPNLRAARMRLRNLMVQTGTTSLFASSTSTFWLDGVEVRGKAGLETNTAIALSSAAPAAGKSNLSITNCRIWRTGWAISAANLKNKLMRATQHSRAGYGSVMVKNRFIPKAEDPTVTGQQYTYQMVSDVADIGSLEDVVLAYNDGRYSDGVFLQTRTVAAATAGTTWPSYRRHLILNNLVERIGNTQSNLANYGEDESCTMSYIVHEGNSFVGDRFNAYYSDPFPTTVADTNSQYNEAFAIRLANNFHDRQPSKQDDFLDNQTATLRGTADGYRPQMIYAWGPHYGVGYEGNFEAGRTTSLTIAQHEYFGLRSVGADIIRDPQFVNDLSITGPGGAAAPGGGDYTPGPASPLKGRVLRGNSDRDVFGAARVSGGAAGAIEAPGTAPTALSPDGGRSSQTAAGTLVGLMLPLAPANGRSGHAAMVTALGWSAVVSPMGGTLADRAATTITGLGLSLTPAGARNAQAATSPSLGVSSVLAPASSLLGSMASIGAVDPVGGGVALVPDISAMQLLPAPALLLPDGALAALHTLFVRADPRTLFVK